MAEDFKALREYRQKKRQSNLGNSTQILKDNSIEFESKNNGVHLIVKGAGKTFDFFPSTGLFILRGINNKVKGRGVYNLMKRLGASNEN